MTESDLPDVNVLVALLHPNHVHHYAAREWFASTERFGTTPITESGFMRISLNRAVSGDRVTPGGALASLRSLRLHPRAVFLENNSSLADSALDLQGLIGQPVTDQEERVCDATVRQIGQDAHPEHRALATVANPEAKDVFLPTEATPMAAQIGRFATCPSRILTHDRARWPPRPAADQIGTRKVAR